MKAPWSLIKNTVLIGASVAALMVIAACSNSNKSTGGTACPPNMVFDGANCVSPTNSGFAAGTQVAFFAQTQNMSGYYNSGGSQMNLGPGFATLLRDAMGTCDRTTNAGGGSSGGLAACNQWVSGYHDMAILLDGSAANSAKLIMRSSPQVNPFANYYYSIPSFKNFILSFFGFGTGNVSGFYNPLVLDMTVWPANNNAGFEMRAKGPTGSYAWSRLLQLQVLNNKIEDPALGFTLYIDGGNQQMLNAVSGTMVRCQTQNCALTNF